MQCNSLMDICLLSVHRPKRKSHKKIISIYKETLYMSSFLYNKKHLLSNSKISKSDLMRKIGNGNYFYLDNNSRIEMISTINAISPPNIPRFIFQAGWNRLHCLSGKGNVWPCYSDIIYVTSPDKSWLYLFYRVPSSFFVCQLYPLVYMPMQSMSLHW